MNTLILTGWGWRDYACAAAVALRKYPLAKVLGVSTGRLPVLLGALSGYEQIIILGVGLSADPPQLHRALEKLRVNGAGIHWISALPPPAILPPETLAQLKVTVDQGSLTEITAETLGQPCTDLLPILAEKSKSHHHRLLDAAMYAYRIHQDEAAYPQAIRHLAAHDPQGAWSSAERRLVEDYLRHGHRELIGKDPLIVTLRQRIARIAPHDRARVLITGESGTGKETVAYLLHSQSPRRHEPYIAFNCASVNPQLLESRFLGHEKGAFTGAHEQKRGLFEQAHSGTLFLDEIGELPLEAQGILLRVLEESRFTRLGGKEEITVDVRLITATHRDLPSMVRARTFREDLFYRLAVVPIHIPALREHPADIPLIASAHWFRHHRSHLTPQELAPLTRYDYPGNVRELLNLLERAAVLGETDFSALLAEHQAYLTPTDSTSTLPDNFDAMTRLHIRRVFEKHNRNLTQTAEALAVTRNTVRKYLENPE